jgi:hypothetical protein
MEEWIPVGVISVMFMLGLIANRLGTIVRELRKANRLTEAAQAREKEFGRR